MALKILPLFLALAVASGVSAQEVKTEAEKAPPAKQDPQKPAEIDRIDELKAQLERARAELGATRQMVEAGGLPAQIRPFLETREMQGRVLDLGVEAIPGEQAAVADAQPAQPAGERRLLSDEEKERLGPDVIMTVDGEPATKAEFDDVYAYMASRPKSGDETKNKRDAMRALVIQKAALAHFKDKAPAAREKMAAVEELLADGGDFAEIAKTHSQCPTASLGGDLGMFERGVMDPIFEQAAFQTKVGQTSGVIQSAFGYHIVKVTGHQDGDREQVRASHILIMFDADQQAIRQTMMDAMNGNVELAFATDEWAGLSPF